MKSNLFSDLLQDFKTLYKQYNKIDYAEDQGDRKAIGMIINKVKSLKPGLNSEAMRIQIKQFFEASFNVSPKWIKDNLTLKLINSQFNVIRKAWNEYNPSKQYAEQNLRDNYNKYGNKKTTFSKSEPTQLTEILKALQPENNIQ